MPSGVVCLKCKAVKMNLHLLMSIRVLWMCTGHVSIWYGAPLPTGNAPTSTVSHTRRTSPYTRQT